MAYVLREVLARSLFPLLPAPTPRTSRQPSPPRPVSKAKHRGPGQGGGWPRGPCVPNTVAPPQHPPAPSKQTDWSLIALPPNPLGKVPLNLPWPPNVLTPSIITLSCEIGRGQEGQPGLRESKSCRVQVGPSPGTCAPHTSVLPFAGVAQPQERRGRPGGVNVLGSRGGTQEPDAGSTPYSS